MARIRNVKPEFWTSEQVVECSPNARLLFIGMWNFFDDGGNHPVSIKTLKLKILPADDFTGAEIQTMVDELITHKLLVEYSANGAMYWHITGWHHQKIERPTYKYPLPSNYSSSPRRMLVALSPPDVSSSDVSSSDVSSSDAKGNGRARADDLIARIREIGSWRDATASAAEHELVNQLAGGADPAQLVRALRLIWNWTENGIYAPRLADSIRRWREPQQNWQRQSRKSGKRDPMEIVRETLEKEGEM